MSGSARQNAKSQETVVFVTVSSRGRRIWFVVEKLTAPMERDSTLLALARQNILHVLRGSVQKSVEILGSLLTAAGCNRMTLLTAAMRSAHMKNDSLYPASAQQNTLVGINIYLK